MTRFFGRRGLLNRINELHRSGQHVSVVGASNIGKTALLNAVVAQHAQGSELFIGAATVDFRHDPPNSTEAALRRVGSALVDVFRSAAGGELQYLADEIDLGASAEELYDKLKIALDIVAEGEHRVLLVLDGCDAVLQNSAIPRNLWDNLRALTQPNSLRLMTGSRDHLHRLCYNPEARTSDFFRIFYDEPIVVGPFDEADWEAFHSDCGLSFDGPAKKELVNWTGGHPDLIDVLVLRMPEVAKDATLSKDHVDEAAESLFAHANGRVEALWRNCPQESQHDIVHLALGPISAADMPAERIKYLVDRGIAVVSGRKVRLANRFVERIAGTRRADVSGARSLFERPEDFSANIRTVLELRIAQIEGGDDELVKLVRRAVKHLPDEPDAALACARDILDYALDLVWAVETPGDKVPQSWVEHWRTTEVETGRRIPAAEDYAKDRRVPEERGRQCALLRVATGQHRVRPCTSRLSKGTYVLIEHMNQVGDLRNHSRVEPTVTMAAAFCLSAIELVDALARELCS